MYKENISHESVIPKKQKTKKTNQTKLQFRMQVNPKLFGNDWHFFPFLLN